jgi:hypothetical protein
MYCNYKITRAARRVAAAVLAVWSLAAAAAPLVAQDSWLLQISEKENQLAHPTDPMWMKANMWDIGYQRVNDRNMPVLELTNLQPAGGPDITQFQLTIGDSRFNFSDVELGEFAMLATTTPQYDDFELDSSGGNTLVVNIMKDGGGGLAPGDVVRFKIDLDVDPGFTDPPFFADPDYRTVLFDMNGVQVYGPDPSIPAGAEDNAQATVLFSNGTTSTPATFIDEMVFDPSSQYYNNIFRPYGVMEPVRVFKVGGGTVIPEPSSCLLALVGLLGGMRMAARSRR